MTFRIVSYNVLVPIYADQPDFYMHCDPQYLKTAHRWNLIRSQLEAEITTHENTIICLQELCQSQRPQFEEFFRLLNYTLHYRLYGQARNDYMGVGIAVPDSVQVDQVSMINLGDRIRSALKPRGKGWNVFSWVQMWYESLANNFKRYPLDPWETAMVRQNTLVCLQVTIGGRTLCIGTYHMPCLYMLPDVMIIHASVVKDLMFELAAGRDFILAGDFNVDSRSVCYAALTQKDYNEYRFPSSNSYAISYRPNRSQVMKSAYQTRNGKEPAYTNYSHTSGSPAYCEAIDYIFFSGNLTVESVLTLPDQPTGTSYPDQTHPSDHLLIAATFRFG